MKIVLFIILILIVLLICILLSKITIRVHYYHGNDNDQLKVIIKALFGIVSKKIDVPVIKVQKDSTSVVIKERTESNTNKEKEKKRINIEDIMNSFHDTREMIQHVKDAYPILKKFFKKVGVHQFQWQSAIGTKDAALTAKITGVIWGIKGIVQACVYKYLSVQCQPSYQVTPYFNRGLSATEFRCILSVRIGYAILTAFKLIRHWRGGKLHLKSSTFQKQNNQTNKTV
ncbi:DUF2953 domain-containing protein [Bacillus massiliigorillae]|uniref:DUF2953 domain-containing protein n=1 Tax=Bacillus massiliigorillae TaxID=1243664 RepID=UPI0003A586BC|nr:DUF2953 domain-containing protein [Bacillus massiliigorillae]